MTDDDDLTGKYLDYRVRRFLTKNTTAQQRIPHVLRELDQRLKDLAVVRKALGAFFETPGFPPVAMDGLEKSLMESIKNLDLTSQTVGDEALKSLIYLHKDQLDCSKREIRLKEDSDEQ